MEAYPMSRPDQGSNYIYSNSRMFEKAGFKTIAPFAAGDDELVDLELRMNALCPVKQICVERILCGKPAQDRQFPFCHRIPFERFCSSDSGPDMIFQRSTLSVIKVHTQHNGESQGRIL